MVSVALRNSNPLDTSDTTSIRFSALTSHVIVSNNELNLEPYVTAPKVSATGDYYSYQLTVGILIDLSGEWHRNQPPLWLVQGLYHWLQLRQNSLSV